MYLMLKIIWLKTFIVCHGNSLYILLAITQGFSSPLLFIQKISTCMCVSVWMCVCLQRLLPCETEEFFKVFFPFYFILLIDFLGTVCALGVRGSTYVLQRTYIE